MEGLCITGVESSSSNRPAGNLVKQSEIKKIDTCFHFQYENG
jgi:hypothetical protein